MQCTRSTMRRNAAEDLNDTTDVPEPPEDTIGPEITAPAPEPLLTTTDSFAAAGRKLIDRKRLAAKDDGDWQA
jgi:hypothetical protein